MNHRRLLGLLTEVNAILGENDCRTNGIIGSGTTKSSLKHLKEQGGQKVGDN